MYTTIHSYALGISLVSTDTQFDLLVKPVTEMGSHIYSLCVFMSPNAHSLTLLLLLNLAQQLSGRAFFLMVSRFCLSTHCKQTQVQ